jgi:malonyl-CoA decarboxylase|tara:strand:+ start:509 stop:1840 length:1332 start_codon:yes stop_codon:yes gene_type:complete
MHMQQLAHQLLQKTIRRWVPFWRDLPKQQHLLEKLSLDPHLNAADEKVLLTWMDACLKSDGGEVAARGRAAELGRHFLGLNDAGRVRFLSLMADNYNVDEAQLTQVIESWLAADSGERVALEAQLRIALEPPRMKLLAQFNELPQGIKFLVDMRAQLLRLTKKHPNLAPLEADLKRLLSAWFDVGLLQMEEINWRSSAELLEKLIAYEAVHAIKDWNDLKNRLDSDRRCFAFFHPNMPDEPLIFVEVALVKGMANNVQELLDETAPLEDIGLADTAIFYSISNAQAGLSGISFGNFLIKRVVKQLQQEFTQLTAFATLSPIPGFCRWLDNIDVEQESALLDEGVVLRSPEHMQKMAIHYLGKEKQKRNPSYARDPVAHFHLSNGAQIERLNWLADTSDNGLKQSQGMMVNYLYQLPHIESRIQDYSTKGKVALSASIEKKLSS